SVYYGAYSLKKTIVPAPTVTAVAPEGTAGVHLGEATFTATATENPTGWNWDFGGGATPNTSTAAAPTVTLGSPGTYTGTVTASNANGTSAAFPFSYAVATEPSWTRYNLSNVKAPQLTTAVIDGRPAFAYHPSEAASGGYWYATAADPTAAAQWVHSAVPDTTAGYPQALIDYNGLPVVAYYSSAGGDHQLRMLLGQTASPTTAAHWSSHTLYDPAGSGVEAGVTVHNGLLAVLYSGADAADDGLLVARTSIATPTAASDWAIHRAVVGGGTQGPVDLDVVNGRLAGTYMVATEEIADSVGYLRATADDPTEASHWAGHEIARANIPAGAKLLVAGGLPIVAFTKANGVIGIGENPGLYIARTATATPSGAEDWTYHRLAAGGITDRWDWDACLQGGRLTYASTDPANNLIRIFRALTTEPSGAADYRTITQFNASQTWSAVGVSAGGGSGTVVTHQPTQLTQVGETNLAW
ncbi:MAG TPA: PKD domain-containing protein, partial [bacterium]|nr:PKD domain-containing protein [bacterium]